MTAERRAEPLFNVPATITAISGDQLQNLGITSMKSIVEMVPNAVLPDDPENFETYINIRGVHQADINAEPNFGLYRNGIFAGGERANLGAQIDVDNVDVLSGPQSGLYGRDAVGGVVNVNYKTASTSDPLGGYAIASYGNWERSELQGAVNIPLTDNFAVRATGWWINENQGQILQSDAERLYRREPRHRRPPQCQMGNQQPVELPVAGGTRGQARPVVRRICPQRHRRGLQRPLLRTSGAGPRNAQDRL